MYLQLFLFLILWQTLVWACEPETYYSPKRRSTTTSTGKPHWEVAADDKAKWAAWLDDYKKKLAAEKAAGLDEVDDPHIATDKNLPQDWKGYGPGFGGIDPPPWAVFPGAHGKPQLCFLEPSKGQCNYTLTRWGYNPHMRACQKFNFSGCGGNDNNFRNKALCDVTCAVDVATNCQTFGDFDEYT